MQTRSSRRLRVLILSLACLAIAIAGVRWLRPGPSPASTVPQAPVDAGTASEPVGPQPRRAVVGAPARDAAPNAIEDPAAASARQLELLSARLAQEPRDPAWAARTEQEIGDAMVRALANNELSEPPPMAVDCRSRTCHIRLGGTVQIDPEIAAQWLMLELAGTLPRAQTVTAAGPGGAPETHVFALR